MDVKKWMLPASLISTGLVVHFADGKIGKHYLQEQVQRCCATDTKVDNYIQYSPIALMYGADLLGVKTQNDAFDQTKYLLMAELLNTIIVRSLKPLLKVERPGGGNFHSFPSGHTSNTFASATVLFQEFKDTAPILAYSGYFVGGAVGTLRVTNNRHWVSDVLVGAGIGTFSALVIYYFKPLKNWRPFDSGKITFLPAVNADYFSAIVVIAL